MAREKLSNEKAGQYVRRAYEAARSAGAVQWLSVAQLATYCDLTGEEIRTGIAHLTMNEAYAFVNNRLGRV